MNNNFNELKKHILKLKIRKIKSIYLNEFIKFLTIGICLFIIILCLDIVIYISPLVLRRIILFSYGMVLVFFIYKIYLTAKSSPLKLENINKEIESKYPTIEDKLVNSASLFKQRTKYSNLISKEIINQLLQDTLGCLKKMPADIISLKKTNKNSILFAGAVILAAFFIISFKTRVTPSLKRMNTSLFEKINYYINVEPKDISVAKGDNLQIKAETNTAGTPEIIIKEPTSQYTDRLSPVQRNNFEYIIENINYEILYRIISADRREKTQWYKIKIKPPPAVKEMDITYFYPSYTKKEPEKSKSREIEALKGTT
ncbi:MAG: hypothetical protein ACOC5R_02250, partial [Elusimicrobiota bacterium]